MRVVAQEIALGQLELWPEQFREIGDADPRAVGERERPISAAIFQYLQLRYDRGRVSISQCPWGPTPKGYSLGDFRLR